eukprot:1933179-Pyramimonas_sp.AAC.1
MSHNANPYTVAEMTVDVVQFLNLKSVDNAIIIGHGLGSLVAMQMARDHPDRVSKLVLVGSTPGNSGNATTAHNFWDSTHCNKVSVKLADPYQGAYGALYKQARRRKLLKKTLPEPSVAALVRDGLFENKPHKPRNLNPQWDEMKAIDQLTYKVAMSSGG